MSAERKRPRKWRRGLWSVGALAVAVGVPAAAVHDQLFEREARPHYESVEDLFKYGSLGVERTSGLPYKLWRVLPDAFPYLMPADSGYRSFGFIYEEGRDVPLGLTKVRIGFDRVGTNCALCHISRYRETPEDEPTLYMSGTNTTIDVQKYFNFLFAAANEWRFNADTLIAYMEREEDLGPVEERVYRHVLIPEVRQQLKDMQSRLSWWYGVPEVGPGRWIAFNDLKFYFAGQPQDGSVGNPDVPPLWNMAPRQATGNIHWDGFSDDIRKSAQNAVIAGGAFEKDIPRDDLARLVEWWMVQPAPKWPFEVDEALAAEGEGVWEASCASCHEIGNPTAGRIIPVEEVGTDRHRYDLITEATVERYNEVATEWYGWEEPQIRKTEGYNAVLLDGVWLRAPYLHNGSVPTLADLLSPPEERPDVFWRGYDVYDQENVGYVSGGAEAEAVGFRYDTSLPGNGNQGHLWGTDLPEEQKRALIEYLKTL